jgi:antitoxin component YwqK of YwqJK toxin-antitoxin module
MKNIVFLLLVVSSYLFSCEQKNERYEGPSALLSDLPSHAEIVDFAEVPGLVQATIMFGEKIEEQGYFFNEKRNGTWVIYHPNEFIKSITTYVNGIQQGAYIEMDKAGKITKKANYLNGIEDGETHYYDNGKIAERKNYSLGQLEGKKSKYYNNGKIMEESMWQDGKMHGEAKWFDQEGNVTIEYRYENGELIKE